MNEQTPSRTVCNMNAHSRPTTSSQSYPSHATTHAHPPPHLFELSGLPRSPGGPLTPPDSNSSKQPSHYANQHHHHHHHPTTPTFVGPNLTAQDRKAQLIAEQEWQIELLTSQRAIDRKSIARLEADRERREDYYQQRDQHRIWVTQQWANGIEEIARLDRRSEESKEHELSRFEGQVAKAQYRESTLTRRIVELMAEVGRLEDQLVAFSCREQESELTSHATVEIARAALVERADADDRNEQLVLTVARLKDEARKFWGFAGSVLAVLVLLVVLVDSY